MLEHEFEEFLKQNKNITVDFDGEYAYCRNENLPWYQANKENATRISKEKFAELTPAALISEINKGLQVEQITRITGYMTKLSSWNAGKRGELKDRFRMGGYFTNLSSSPNYLRPKTQPQGEHSQSQNQG